MMNKTKRRVGSILLSLLFYAIYGTILYFFTTWLAGYSLLFAYLGNLALIVLVLVADELTIKSVQSEKFLIKMEREKDPEKYYQSVQLGLNNNVSFKTDLYVFYIFILIASQVVEFYPTLVGEGLVTFLLTNSYSILLLIAFDMLIGQFTKDRERTKKILEELKTHYAKIQS